MQAEQHWAINFILSHPGCDSPGLGQDAATGFSLWSTSAIEAAVPIEATIPTEATITPKATITSKAAVTSVTSQTVPKSAAEAATVVLRLDAKQTQEEYGNDQRKLHVFGAVRARHLLGHVGEVSYIVVRVWPCAPHNSGFFDQGQVDLRHPSARTITSHGSVHRASRFSGGDIFFCFEFKCSALSEAIGSRGHVEDESTWCHA